MKINTLISAFTLKSKIFTKFTILLFFISMILPFGYRNHTEDVFLDLVLISFGFD